MFLVMGFTGKKAAQIKEAFVEAFNMMEERLRNPVMVLPEVKRSNFVLRMLRNWRRKVAEMEPKAEVHDRTMDLGDSMTMTNAAKILGIGPKAIGPLLDHPQHHPGDPQDRLGTGLNQTRTTIRPLVHRQHLLPLPSTQ